MNSEKTISLVIETTRGTDTLDFPTTATVEEVVQAARKYFGLDGAGQFALVIKDSGEQLKPADEKLANFKLKDKVVLVLTGGGVNV
ncbi:MAG: hypothetical protein OXG83_14945 [Acidobacteria bacterium]|nr:hypothetical protein [Acidobacteriota bacterium]